MYQAVVYGIEEQLTGDVRDTVIAFWHTTVEPFFGRPQRPYQQLHTKTELQQLEAEEHAGKASSSSDQVRSMACMLRVCTLIDLHPAEEHAGRASSSSDQAQDEGWASI
jgi:hypothetical protein